VDHEVAAGYLCRHVSHPGNADNGGDLLPRVARASAINIDLQDAVEPTVVIWTQSVIAIVAGSYP
jgi:hypothetical protein